MNLKTISGKNWPIKKTITLLFALAFGILLCGRVYAAPLNPSNMYYPQSKGTGAVSLRDYAFGRGSPYRYLQGSCTDGKYGYFILEHTKHNNLCAIVKVKLSNGKIVKTRKKLRLNHGNDMCYDAKSKSLIVVNCHGAGDENAKKITYINPKTLKKKKTKKLDQILYGVAYNNKKKRFAFGVSGTDTIVIKNRKFKTVDSFEILPLGDYTRQGIDCDNKYIYIFQSRMHRKESRMMVYTWKGKYVNTVIFYANMEAESLFHIGKRFVLSFNDPTYNGGQIYETKLTSAQIRGK